MQVAISGNTYPVKDALKAIGAKWDADNKCWTITSTKVDEARKIVANAPEQAPATPGVCLKCKGSVKAPYTICWACKQGAASPRYSSGRGGGYRSNRRACGYCGSTSCAKAYNPNDLCDED